MTRPTYVYRLKVEYPEGVGQDNPPKGWEPDEFWTSEGPDYRPFSWPPPRNYLSESGANIKADILRGWGCTVTIERSQPVTWPSA